MFLKVASHNRISLKAVTILIALFLARTYHVPEALRVFPKPPLQFSLPRVRCSTPISGISGSGVLRFFSGVPMPLLAPAGIFRNAEEGMGGIWRAGC